MTARYTYETFYQLGRTNNTTAFKFWENTQDLFCAGASAYIGSHMTHTPEMNHQELGAQSVGNSSINTPTWSHIIDKHKS